MRLRSGLRPGPRWGSLQRSPDSLAIAMVTGEVSGKGDGMREKGRKGMKGRGEEEWKGMYGRGRIYAPNFRSWIPLDNISELS